jgi:hypothetical protein
MCNTGLSKDINLLVKVHNKMVEIFYELGRRLTEMNVETNSLQCIQFIVPTARIL